MPELIAGMDKKQLLIYGGLGALGVGVVVYLRYQSAQNAAPQSEFPQAPPDTGGGGGGGGFASPVSVAAPTQQAADTYQAGLNQAEVDAAKLQNQYMGEQLRQSKAGFDLQQTLQQQEASIMEPAQRAYAALVGAQYGAETNYYNQISKREVSCPGTASLRIDPTTGQAYCRQKTSGSVGPIPVGDIVRAVKEFVGGVEAYAPQAGYSAAQAGSQVANQYIGTLGPTRGMGPTQGQGKVSIPKKPQPQGYGQLPAPGDFGGHF